MASRLSILAIEPSLRMTRAGDYLAVAPADSDVLVGAMGGTEEEARAAFDRALDRAARAYLAAGLAES